MTFKLTPLPFPKDALEPFISAKTIDFHYEKHHRGYVEKLNKLIKGTEHEEQSLEEIIQTAAGKVFNNAAQVWNHNFFWNCLKPGASSAPTGTLLKLINLHFGSLDEFEKQFSKKAEGLFGSGWVWLACDVEGKLSIEALSNAGTPICDQKQPLLTLDVWEHAYYLDYQNERAKFIEGFWNHINWAFAERNIQEANFRSSRSKGQHSDPGVYA